MLERCYNPKHASYGNYGGRGIRVYGPWHTSFLDFLGEVGPKPPGSFSLDRIDNNGDYEPGNIRWADRKEQGRKTRRNHYVTFQGTTRCIAEWAEVLGINVNTLYARFLTMHWTPERALTKGD